jgi:hypothetical protein
MINLQLIKTSYRMSEVNTLDRLKLYHCSFPRTRHLLMRLKARLWWKHASDKRRHKPKIKVTHRVFIEISKQLVHVLLVRSGIWRVASRFCSLSQTRRVAQFDAPKTARSTNWLVSARFIPRVQHMLCHPLGKKEQVNVAGSCIRLGLLPVIAAACRGLSFCL